MDGTQRPSRRQIRRRRRLALGAIALLALLAAYLILEATLLVPAERHGARVSHLTIHSRAVGEDLGVSVIEPLAATDAHVPRPLLVFLHGRGGSERTFLETGPLYMALAALGPGAPVMAFPDGGDHGYWHDRDEGDWDRYVVEEVMPAVTRRFRTDPNRVAIGGISMGGFGAYDLAMLHPGRFCAVGGHSPALWFEGGETAPGAFDSAEDFERNDVVGAAQSGTDPFAGIPVWDDYGDEDPFRVYDEGFVDALRADGADISAHSWHGGHDNDYWNRHWKAYLRFYARALAGC
jgi:S-formylglutathione hydrolase FrmB